MPKSSGRLPGRGFQGVLHGGHAVEPAFSEQNHGGAGWGGGGSGQWEGKRRAAVGFRLYLRYTGSGSGGNVVINNHCPGLVPVASVSLHQEDGEILHGLIMVVIIGRLE